MHNAQVLAISQMFVTFLLQTLANFQFEQEFGIIECK
jgi:hypothetical protein